MGTIYKGKVERIVDFGAFVNILPGKDGLVHISQIADRRIENVTDELSAKARKLWSRYWTLITRPRQALHERSG